ncbi:MAG: ABC transporter substrate-binding protein [Betaproteobacteria bacterium]
MKTTISLLFALFLPFASAVHAQSAASQSPEDMVRQITNDVLEAIQGDKALQAGDKQKALALAEQKVLPHLDFTEMTRLAAGRTWNTATAEQKERLVSAFRAMLVRTYANAIDVYRGQTMTVEPSRVPATATEATVRNRYSSPGRRPTPVDYLMRKAPGASGWKIYDIIVDGISLVLTYRSQFEESARASGIEGLIKQLQEKTQPALRSKGA